MNSTASDKGNSKSLLKALLRATSNSMGSVILTLIILVVVLSIVCPNFLSAKNILSVMQQVAYIAIMAAGMSFLLISGDIDLSVAATLAITAAFTGEMYVNHGMPAWIAIALSFAIGCGCGLLNSFFITRFNLTPMIVTLAGMQIYRGAASVFTGGFTSLGMPEPIRWIGQGRILGGIPVCIIVMIIVYVVSWFVLSKTRFGMNLYAMGGNVNAARLSGISIGHTRMRAYVINGLFAALAGVVLSGRMNSSSSSLADGIEMDVIAAAVIGGMSLNGGEGNVWGALFGSLLMGVLKNGMNQLSIHSFWQQIILGIVLMLAIIMDSLRNAGSKK